jgi:hypothetical protein
MVALKQAGFPRRPHKVERIYYPAGYKACTVRQPAGLIVLGCAYFYPRFFKVFNVITLVYMTLSSLVVAQQSR